MIYIRTGHACVRGRSASSGKSLGISDQVEQNRVLLFLGDYCD